MGACPALPCARPRPSPRSVVVFRSLARRVLRGRLASLASAIPRAARLPALALSASLSCPAPPILACASRPSCPAPLGFGGQSRCTRGRGGSAIASHTSPALRIAPRPPEPRSLLPARLPRPPVRARPPSAPSARGRRVVPPRWPRATSAPRASPFLIVSSCLAICVHSSILLPPMQSRSARLLPRFPVISSCHRCSRAPRACFPRALNIVKNCRSPLRPFRGSARGIPCQNISSACLRKIRGSAASPRPFHGLSYPSPIHRR